MNPHLKSLSSDFLYHIGYSRDELMETFSDVKFVVMGGSAGRMGSFAELVASKINHPHTEKEKLNISRTDRYSMYKIGSVLSVNHGMGVPSVTILLHEIIKLLHYVGAVDAVIFRLGTCGGIGIDPGTVVITNKTVNAFLKEEHVIVVLGEPKPREAVINQELAKAMLECQDDASYKTILGTTMCTDDFYEGQARIDGALCEFTEKDRADYIKKLNDNGVDNIEMECTAMASICHAAGVRCGIVCVALVNRLNGTDQVEISPEEYKTYQSRPQELIAKFIAKQLSQ